MERNTLRRIPTLAQPPAARPFVYRSAGQNSSLPHPLRRSTDAVSATPTVFSGPVACGVLLQVRICVKLD